MTGLYRDDFVGSHHCYHCVESRHRAGQNVGHMRAVPYEPKIGKGPWFYCQDCDENLLTRIAEAQGYRVRFHHARPREHGGGEDWPDVLAGCLIKAQELHQIEPRNLVLDDHNLIVAVSPRVQDCTGVTKAEVWDESRDEVVAVGYSFAGCGVDFFCKREGRRIALGRALEQVEVSRG